MAPSPAIGSSRSQRQIQTRQEHSTLTLIIGGNWTISSGLAGFDQVIKDAGSLRDVRELAFDASGLGAWDSSLVTFLFQAADYCEANNIALQIHTLPDNLKELLTLARAVPEKDTGGEEQKKPWLERIADWSARVGDEGKAFATFTGECALSLGRFVTFQTKMRWSDLWVQVETTGPSALGIVTLISFLIGLIIAFLGAVVLEPLGGSSFSPQLVGFAIVRELGALMTGIIIAGRTGAAYAAEIGTMKVSEELDALQTMGLSTMDFIVLPRLLALFFMMPILTIYADFVGVLSGMITSIALMDITPTQFIETLVGALKVKHFAIGVFKGTVYGGVIAISGCMRGMQSGSSAGAVGVATTSAVVTGITLVIVSTAIVDFLAALYGI